MELDKNKSRKLISSFFGICIDHKQSGSGNSLQLGILKINFDPEELTLGDLYMHHRTNKIICYHHTQSGYTRTKSNGR